MRAPPERRLVLSLLLGLTVGLAFPPEAAACDVCATYTVEELGELRHGPRLGVAEQFTHFGSTFQDSQDVPNIGGEFLNNSITQVALGWRFTDWFDAQLVVPVIHRSWRRNFEDGIQEESRTGLGDISTIGRLRAFSAKNERGLFRLSGYGGLTFPSGDTSALAEEAQEEPNPGLGRVAHSGDSNAPEHETPSAIHGHDLTFGTGSVGGLIGAEVLATWDRFLVTGNLQYSLYTEGAYDYHFANELSFRGGIGYYLWLADEGSLALQGSVGGFTKGQDSQSGTTLDDTAATYVFAGPRLIGRIDSRFSLDLGVGIPFVRHETSLQIAPDWRIQAAFAWKF